jgi:ribonuclease T2
MPFTATLRDVAVAEVEAIAQADIACSHSPPGLPFSALLIFFGVCVMRARAVRILLCSSLSLVASGATADTPASGTFVARQSCPALQSIRTGANPGNVSVEPDGHYSIFAKNKPNATHYLIDVPDARPGRRWVAVGCGEARLAEGGGQPASGGEEASGEPEHDGGQTAQKPDYILAVSWQPAFCEGKPDKTECETQRHDRFDATHFTLHGLWPKKQYCNVDRHIVAADKDNRWNGLPEPELSDATRHALSEVMPERCRCSNGTSGSNMARAFREARRKSIFHGCWRWCRS